jgi:hypothetical protein
MKFLAFVHDFQGFSLKIGPKSRKKGPKSREFSTEMMRTPQKLDRDSVENTKQNQIELEIIFAEQTCTNFKKSAEQTGSIL